MTRMKAIMGSVRNEAARAGRLTPLAIRLSYLLSLADFREALRQGYAMKGSQMSSRIPAQPVTRPVMPCGYARTGVKLSERHKHYQTCEDRACQERWTAWETLVAEASKPGAIKMVARRSK